MRFKPPLIFLVKGKLPSDEQIVLFSQDKNAKAEYEKQILKLNR
jgi:hypothetical protein